MISSSKFSWTSNTPSKRTPMDAELRVKRSLEKLSVPEWFLKMRSKPPKILTNTTPIESRAAPWRKSFKIKTNTSRESIDTSVYSEISRITREIEQLGGSSTEKSEQKSIHQSRPNKSTGCKKKVISATFPKVSPSRKIQNINIMLPVAPTPKPESPFLSSLACDSIEDLSYKIPLNSWRTSTAKKKPKLEVNRNKVETPEKYKFELRAASTPFVKDKAPNPCWLLDDATSSNESSLDRPNPRRKYKDFTSTTDINPVRMYNARTNQKIAYTRRQMQDLCLKEKRDRESPKDRGNYHEYISSTRRLLHDAINRKLKEVDSRRRNFVQDMIRQIDGKRSPEMNKTSPAKMESGRVKNLVKQMELSFNTSGLTDKTIMSGNEPVYKAKKKLSLTREPAGSTFNKRDVYWIPISDKSSLDETKLNLNSSGISNANSYLTSSQSSSISRSVLSPGCDTPRNPTWGATYKKNSSSAFFGADRTSVADSGFSDRSNIDFSDLSFHGTMEKNR